MATKIIKLEEATAKKLYKTASPELKTILEENFGKQTLSDKVTDRISNFDDILSELGTTLEEIIPWKGLKFKLSKKKISQNALAKIQAITEVYNEGEGLNWTNTCQSKYYIWWEKKARGGWVLDVVDDSDYSADLGSGCYFKSQELALDAASKFKDIFIEFLPE